MKKFNVKRKIEKRKAAGLGVPAVLSLKKRKYHPKTKIGQLSARRIEHLKTMKRAQRARHLRITLALFAVVLVIFCLFMKNDYLKRPGVVGEDTLTASERGTDYITVQWDAVRNTDEYVLVYKKRDSNNDWTEIRIANTSEYEERDCVEYKVDNLEEGTAYIFSVRPENDEKEGIQTDEKTFVTKMSQKVCNRKTITKLTSSKTFVLKSPAKTRLSYSIKDTSVASINKLTGKISIKKAGRTKIRIKAEGNELYDSATEEVELLVLNDAGDSSDAKIIFDIGENNCETIMSISGDGSIHVPQGLAYTGDSYIVAYGMKSAQRVISFDIKNKKKKIIKPTMSMGHPNGFTYCSNTGLCYSVRGWTGLCVTYSPETGKFDSFNLPCGCSGIAYDRIDNVFYTSSRTAMRMFSGDGKFKQKRSIRPVKHSVKVFTQDCGGHAGIMMHCLSGSSKHGDNYIDLYNMEKGTYIGTIRARLSEVESATVDEDGYMVLLANNSSKTDRILRTNINIEDLA